jgi:dihydroorotate dehydrogenase
MYPVFRSLLFRLEPEQAHSLTLSLLNLGARLPVVRQGILGWFRGPQRVVQAFGLTFPNPVGLAAGYDKDGLGWPGLALLGFGHIEVGTVTRLPQAGNPRPRVFRVKEEKALINRMGFPGQGAEMVASRLRRKRPPGLILGVNLGKNKDTPLDEAAGDYLSLMRTFTPLADYLAINVSSPNTVGLRRLQARDHLERLLRALGQERKRQQVQTGKPTPILVKLAPDLSDSELEDALDAILLTGMDGVIATNTTVTRSGLLSPLAAEAGGLSGKPLEALSTRMIHRIHKLTEGKLPIVGVGGIMNAAGASRKLEAGAILLQVYTGLIYTGPGLVKQILSGIND